MTTDRITLTWDEQNWLLKNIPQIITEQVEALEKGESCLSISEKKLKAFWNKLLRLSAWKQYSKIYSEIEAYDLKHFKGSIRAGEKNDIIL